MTEHSIRRILVPVDFSPASLNALDSAIAISKQHEADILILNVVETVGLTSGNGYAAAEATLELIHRSEQELLSLQHSITEKFLMPCEIISIHGFVSPTIIKISATYKADIIVMGTNGRSGNKKTFIGLNAFNVVKNADCPVLMVPPEKKWESFKKVLFPLRVIPSALEKYEFLRTVVNPGDMKLKILGLAADYEKDFDVLKNMACRLTERLKEDDVEASAYFKVGKNMAEEVLKIAALMEADLVVITNIIDQLSGQFFVDPYTRHIINHAVFPVLSVKPAKTPAYDNEGSHIYRDRFSHKMPLYN